MHKPSCPLPLVRGLERVFLLTRAPRGGRRSSTCQLLWCWWSWGFWRGPREPSTAGGSSCPSLGNWAGRRPCWSERLTRHPIHSRSVTRDLQLYSCNGWERQIKSGWCGSSTVDGIHFQTSRVKVKTNQAHLQQPAIVWRIKYLFSEF